MKNELIPNWGLPATWLRFLILTVLVIGIFFRFVNLDKKVYWRDEALTSLQIAGYTQVETIGQIANGQLITQENLQKYQQLNSEKNIVDTINALAVETPEHPPLYYGVMRIWAQLFGTSVTALRSFSAIISLLIFPAIYWLCLELFESSITGWIAIALIAVSPFHVLYAQEAREYSLWPLAILLASAALIRAMRINNKSSWAIYGLTLALAFYTFLFSAFVAIAHGIYILTIEGFRFSKKFINYLLACFAAIILFSPWIVTVIVHIDQLRSSMAWINYKFTLPALAQRWIFNLSRIFVDWNYGFSFRTPYPYLVIILILALVGYALYFVIRHTPIRVWLFILTLMGVIALALALPDLISGGQRSRVSRYLIPSYLGIHLSVAYLLSTQINPAVINPIRKKLWQVIMVVLLTGGILSCAISSQAKSWWNKADGEANLKIASVINQSPSPLVISDSLPITNVLSLSHLLDSKVKYQIVVEQKIPQIPDNFSDVYLFSVSKNLRKKLETESGYRIQPASQDKTVPLLKILKSSNETKK